MEIILGLAAGLLITAVGAASTADLHWCTKCHATGSTEFNAGTLTKGKKTIRNPRGLYYTHGGCIERN
jgi:hypothetical protein